MSGSGFRRCEQALKLFNWSQTIVERTCYQENRKKNPIIQEVFKVTLPKAVAYQNQMAKLIVQNVFVSSHSDNVKLVLNPSQVSKKSCTCLQFYTLQGLILGTDGTRLISFEGWHWRDDCFLCYTCVGTLCDYGLVTSSDATAIICSDCNERKTKPKSILKKPPTKSKPGVFKWCHWFWYWSAWRKLREIPACSEIETDLANPSEWPWHVWHSVQRHVWSTISGNLGLFGLGLNHEFRSWNHGIWNWWTILSMMMSQEMTSSLI